MNWTSLGSSTVLAAIVSGAVAVISHQMNRKSSRELHAQQLAMNERLEALKRDRERELEKLNAEHQQLLLKLKARLDRPGEHLGAEIILRQFFNNPRFPGRTRSFENIKKPLVGFEDDTLRRILVTMGASSVTVAGGREGWHLPDVQGAGEDE